MDKYTLVFSCLVFCVITIEGYRKSDDNDAKLEAWLQRQHPEYFETIHKRLEKAKQKTNPRKYFDRDDSFLDFLRTALEEKGSEVNALMESFLAKVQAKHQPASSVSEDVMATEAPLTCDSSVQCDTGARSRLDLLEIWRELVKLLRNEPESCDPCQLTVEGLQETACSGPWEPWRDDIIQGCEALFGLIGIDPIICNGTVTLQGQHLYCIAREASAFEMCESLNLCYPRAATLEPRGRRMPWEVKDELQARLHAKIQASERRRRARRARRQTGTIRVVQLSDIHIQPKYTIGSPSTCKAFVCCLDNSLAIDGTSSARKWGEYFCNLPEATMRVFLEKVNEFTPDFVVYTGDNPPHNFWDETLISQLNCTNIVVNALKEIITPGTRVYPTIGNHEMYPTNLYSMRLPDTSYMNQIFTKMWHGLAGLDASANETFAGMSYYTVVAQPGLRILCLNTNYDWYTTNFYNTLNKNDSFNEEHKQFVVDTLSLARVNDEKVIVLGHHPIGSTVIRAAAWWEDVANEYRDVITLHVSGHTHNDHQHLVIDPDTDEATSVNLVTAITSTIVNVNPSLRVFELDSTTFELLNYESYAFHVNVQNPDEEPDIVLNYDAKEEYNMTDLSPAAWQDLVLRMIDDDVLFQKWYANWFAKAELGPCLFDNVCGDNCKRQQICGIWFPRADEAATCVDNWPTEPPSTVPGDPDPVTGGAIPTAAGVSGGWWMLATLAALVMGVVQERVGI